MTFRDDMGSGGGGMGRTVFSKITFDLVDLANIKLIKFAKSIKTDFFIIRIFFNILS